MKIKSFLSRLAFRLRKRSINKKIFSKYRDYINWLKFANAGMLNEGNVLAFDFATRNMPANSSVIEVGSFCGLSTNTIRYLLNANSPKSILYSCDKWEFEGADDRYLYRSTILHDEYKDFVKESFIRNVRFFSKGNLPYTIESISDTFFSLWAAKAFATDVFGRTIKLGGKIGFCYIDGNHTYKFSKRDFLNADKWLLKGGFILFDDSFDWAGFELSKLMKEIRRLDRYRLIMKEPNYLFKKIK